jgi:hypothetical protein
VFTRPRVIGVESHGMLVSLRETDSCRCARPRDKLTRKASWPGTKAELEAGPRAGPAPTSEAGARRPGYWQAPLSAVGAWAAAWPQHYGRACDRPRSLHLRWASESGTAAVETFNLKAPSGRSSTRRALGRRRYGRRIAPTQSRLGMFSRVPAACLLLLHASQATANLKPMIRGLPGARFGSSSDSAPSDAQPTLGG